jgi:transcription antitermination factor NusG
MDDEDEVQVLIDQLRRLQLQQNELITRLERARGNERQPSPRASPRARREIAIGDRVRIKNPGPFQTNKGVVDKIGESRITVRTASGTKIQRAHKNIVRDNDE